MIYLSRNPIAVQCITANHLQPNFRFEIDIQVQEDGSNEFSTLCTVKGYPDASGYFLFDARSILHSCLLPDLPAFNQSLISACVNIIRPWKAVVKELWGDPPTVQSTSNPASDHVLMGGLSFVDFPGNNRLASNKFLTHQPDNKLVSATQQEFLFYSTFGKSISNIRQHVKVYFDDGTDAVQRLSVNPVAFEGIYIIPAGYAQLQLDSLFEKNIIKYTTWISESDDPESDLKRSEERTYHLDFDYYKQVRYFLYQNSLGAFETLRCTGNVSGENSFDRLTGQRILPADYSPGDAQYFSSDTINRPSIKCNTGTLYRAWKEHLQEFYQSDFRYEIRGGTLSSPLSGAEGGVEGYISIVLSSDKLKLPELIDNIHSDEFEYRYAHENNAYSR